jgi:hypothetical protein
MRSKESTEESPTEERGPRALMKDKSIDGWGGRKSEKQQKILNRTSLHIAEETSDAHRRAATAKMERK